MRIKKKTKRILSRTLVVILCLVMLLPIAVNLVSKPTAQDLIAEQILKNQLESNENSADANGSTMEGSYLVTEVLSADTYKIKWGDEERTLKLIGVADAGVPLDEIRDIAEATLLTLEFDAVSKDENGDFLAYAYLEDGQFLNYYLLFNGLAKLKNEEENTRHMSELKDAQVLAKNSKLGVWEQ